MPELQTIFGYFLVPNAGDPLIETAQRWVEDLSEFVTSYGFDTFIFWGQGEDQLDRFAQEVVPAFRAQ